MKRRVITATLCLLLFGLAVQTAAAKDTWTSLRSKNFFLIGNASEREIRQVAERLEQFREVARHLFIKANFNSPLPTTVVVFKNDSSYRPFKPNANTAGYFQSGPDINYITLKTESSDDLNPFSVIFHEYTHLLVNNTMGNMPTWFNEGLAEYYSSFSMSDDQKVVLGKPIAHHVYLLRANRMLPLRTLFKVNQESPYYNERDKQSIFYAESWALMHYLILGNQGQRREQLFKFTKLTEANLPLEEAFSQAFQTTFENMEKSLREYIRNDSYTVAAGQFQHKLDLDKEMQAAKLSDAEVQAYLGDLLLHSYRPEAESYLQRALTLEPKLAIANAALGMLRVREGKIDEARQSLERAVEANSQNYLIHYYYAYALSREGMDQMQLVNGYQPETAARIRAELKKAIDLRPDYPESYHLLAFVNLVTETQLDESITLLKRVLATSPGRNDLLFTLAQVYMHKQDYETARQILERLRNSGDQRLRQQAEGLLTQLVAREEYLARLETAKQKSLERSEALPPGTDSAASANGVANVAAGDLSSNLRENLRKPGEGEQQVQATLLRIDCDAKGIIFTVRINGRVVKLYTDRFENVRRVAFSADAGREITCGPRKSENAVVICYVPAADARAKIEGTIKSIEFVPKEFKLKA